MVTEPMNDQIPKPSVPIASSTIGVTTRPETIAAA
jgi:hypothetical protein